MYSFEGEFCRKPQQNLGGISKKLNREELLQKNQEERKKRENFRIQTKAAIKIQSFVRTYFFRKNIVQQLQIDLANDLAYLSNSKCKSESDYFLIKKITTYFLFSFKHENQNSNQNLIILSQFFISNKELIFQFVNTKDHQQWIFRLKKIIFFNLKYLVSLIKSNEINSSFSFVPLKFLEIFTNKDNYEKYCPNLDLAKALQTIWSFLINNNYFKFKRKILESKVPKPYEENLFELSILEKSLLELTIRPLEIDPNYFSIDILKNIVLKFFEQYLDGPLPNQIRYRILPALAKSTPNLLKFNNLMFILNKLECNLPCNIWTLFSLLKIISNNLEQSINQEHKRTFLFCIKKLIVTLPEKKKTIDDSDDETENYELESSSKMNFNEEVDEFAIANQILFFLNDPKCLNVLNSLLKLEDENNEILLAFSSIGYSILFTNAYPLHENRILYTLAFHSQFLRRLWIYIISVKYNSSLVTNLLAKAISISDWKSFLPYLSFFCSLFSYLMPINDEIEFDKDHNLNEKKFSKMPFTLNELLNMIAILNEISLGLIELSYHDTNLTNEYKFAIQNSEYSINDTVEIEFRAKHWSFLFKSIINLLRQLHNRDSRQQFCPSNHWIIKNVNISADRPINFNICDEHIRRHKKFINLKKLPKKELEMLGPPILISELKNVIILKEIPFVIPFMDRVQIFKKLVEKDKEKRFGDAHNFLYPGSSIDIVIRRNYLYEDAFEKLSIKNEPDIKKHIRIQLKNSAGLYEAGVDGGGMFREFLSELIKSAFDPNRGFFKSTVDREFYPNPAIEIIQENFLAHFFFIGRIFGKALYENVLTELPISHFFLAKMLSKNQTTDIDIHYLNSLDPLIYKNLLYLKNYEGDVSELGLDFTIVQSDLGENKIVELKSKGASIPVTAQNRIEYIHLMADYILNKRIRPHCSAFKQGLENCIDLDWIRMFNARELQVLISGSNLPIDLEDLKNNTKYLNGYSENHPTILAFWKAVETFTETQKRKLLKFVTSCSRPPLLGFEHLNPSFCIQFAGKENRLPTASTCMNLLKLPELSDWNVLKQKLIYAIESEAGFELS